MTEAGLTGEVTPPPQDASFYAAWCAMNGYTDGFLMLHNRDRDPIFEKTFAEAKKVLFARPDIWNVGGKMTPEIAEQVLSQGAKCAVFGSYVFRAGGPDMERLNRIVSAFGRDRVMLHLRLVRRDSSYYLLSGALDHGTQLQITEEVLTRFAAYCREMVIEIPLQEDRPSLDAGLVLLLARWNQLPVTYLRCIESPSDLDLLEQMGQERIDFSVGRGLALFGGDVPDHLMTFYK